ncbi:MAG: hypothetical protein IT436_15930 [Phycisphaerales bacterium]|nr:hypothetical protein [Phycisphaerales bacterium]
MDDDTTPLRCAACGRRLDLGVDAVSVERCVIGPRGPVPLETPRLYCGDECLRGEKQDKAVRMKRRIP